MVNATSEVSLPLVMEVFDSTRLLEFIPAFATVEEAESWLRRRRSE